MYLFNFGCLLFKLTVINVDMQPHGEGSLSFHTLSVLHQVCSHKGPVHNINNMEIANMISDE